MSGCAHGVASIQGKFNTSEEVSLSYPTRNFARVDPHIAMGHGPYLHLRTSLGDGWRMASEDSRNRDRCFRFIRSVIDAIAAIPSY